MSDDLMHVSSRTPISQKLRFSGAPISQELRFSGVGLIDEYSVIAVSGLLLSRYAF